MLDATITKQADLSLSHEQQDFVRAIRNFCERELPSDRLRELTDDFEDLHSDDLARQMAELGWYGVTVHEQYGGSGGTFLNAALFLEETARGRAPLGGYAVTLIVVGALNRFGTYEQRRDLLARVAQGGCLAIAMSEPDSGSDVASLKTRARRDGDEWVLSGAKMWCSYAHKARHILIVCRAATQGERHPDRLPDRRAERQAARGHLDAARPARRRRPHAHADPNARRQGDQRDPPGRRACAQRGAARRRGRRLDPADGRTEQRARHPRCLGARPGAARVRRRARLCEGAAPVRPPDRQLPGDPAQVRRHGHRPRPGAAAGALGGAPDGRGPGPDAAPGGVDGEARHD